MSTPTTHADLVARALGELSGDEQARVDEAIGADEGLRRQFEEIAAHLLRYDHLPPAPPAPSFERLAEAMRRGAEAGAAPDLRILEMQDRRPIGDGVQGHGAAVGRGVRWTLATVAAAAAVLAVALWNPWRGAQAPTGPTLVPGPGMEVVRDGRAIPAPARAARSLQPGDVLRCEQPAEARLGDRVRLVLDAGAALRIEEAPGAEPAVVRLEAGRAWFEVEPGAFEVRTPYGPVRVLGTAFEVDLRSGALEVGVAAGRVAAGGYEIPAGHRLLGGRVHLDASGAGGWFRSPRLRLEVASAAVLERGTRLRLRLVFENPGQVPLRLGPPAAAGSAIWLGFETEAGKSVREVPVLPANVLSGLALIESSNGTALAPGESKVLTVEILPPLTSPGAYRCRALYRPEGQPAVLSDSVELEVR